MTFYEFYSNLDKGLKSKFLGLIPNFGEVTRKKPVGDLFAPHPPSLKGRTPYVQMLIAIALMQFFCKLDVYNSVSWAVRICNCGYQWMFVTTFALSFKKNRPQKN